MEQTHFIKSNQLIFDHERLHKDLLIKLKRVGLNQRQIKPISRSTLHLLGKGRPITMETMLKCIDWLDQQPERYIYYKRIPPKKVANVQ